MKSNYIILPLLCISMAATAQDHNHGHYNHVHPDDSTDVFFKHLQLNEVVVTGAVFAALSECSQITTVRIFAVGVAISTAEVRER